MSQSSAASDQIPISYQRLPVVVLLDLIEAYGGKHVIDLAPGPLGLAADCPKKCLYFSVCGADVQKSYLEAPLRKSLMVELMDSNSPLAIRASSN